MTRNDCKGHVDVCIDDYHSVKEHLFSYPEIIRVRIYRCEKCGREYDMRFPSRIKEVKG
jgi:hypothetical protein